MACISAVEIEQELEIIQDEFKRKNLPSINVGIGINTGDCIVGNMGSVFPDLIIPSSETLLISPLVWKH